MLEEQRIFSVFRTAARGLEAQRIAIGAATENIANANTSMTEDGDGYQIKRPVHEVAENAYTRFNRVLNMKQSEMKRSSAGHIGESSLRRRLPETEMGPQTEIEELQRERLEYDPSHPHADAQGYVHYPDVNPVQEMSRLISANRLYDANLKAIGTAKDMIKHTLKI